MVHLTGRLHVTGEGQGRLLGGSENWAEILINRGRNMCVCVSGGGKWRGRTKAFQALRRACAKSLWWESLGVQALKEGWHSWSMGIGEKGKRQKSGSVWDWITQGLVGGQLKSLTFSLSHGEPVKAVKQGSGLEVEGHVRLALERPFWLQSGEWIAEHQDGHREIH